MEKKEMAEFIILCSVAFSSNSLCLFVQFPLKYSWFWLLFETAWGNTVNVLLLYKTKFIPCLFVSQTFSLHINFIDTISLIKWKNSGVRVTCKSKALYDKQGHGGVDTKSAV